MSRATIIVEGSVPGGLPGGLPAALSAIAEAISSGALSLDGAPHALVGEALLAIEPGEAPAEFERRLSAFVRDNKADYAIMIGLPD